MTAKKPTTLSKDLRAVLASLPEEIRAILATSGAALTAAEVNQACTLAENATEVSKAMYQMHKKGQLDRSINGDGRYAYSLKEGTAIVQSSGKRRSPNAQVRPAPVSDNVLGEAMQAALAPVFDALQAQSPREQRAAPAATRSGAGFDLRKRLDAIAADIEDALGDAIDSEQPKELVKALVAASGAAHRAARFMPQEVKA